MMMVVGETTNLNLLLQSPRRPVLSLAWTSPLSFWFGFHLSAHSFWHLYIVRHLEKEIITFKVGKTTSALCISECPTLGLFFLDFLPSSLAFLLSHILRSQFQAFIGSVVGELLERRSRTSSVGSSVFVQHRQLRCSSSPLTTSSIESFKPCLINKLKYHISPVPWESILLNMIVQSQPSFWCPRSEWLSRSLIRNIMTKLSWTRWTWSA